MYTHQMPTKVYKIVLMILGMMLSHSGLAKADTLSKISTKRFSYATVEYSDRQLLVLAGNILLRDQSTIMKVVASLHPTKPVYLWVTRSGGGYVQTFNKFSDGLKNFGKRKFYMIVDGFCASACTNLSAMANHTYYVEGSARFGIHRTWAISPKVVIETPEAAAEDFARYGANGDWFRSHLYIFDKSYQESTYRLSDQEALDSGLADEYITYHELDKIFGESVVTEVLAEF